MIRTLSITWLPVTRFGGLGLQHHPHVPYPDVLNRDPYRGVYLLESLIAQVQGRYQKGGGGLGSSSLSASAGAASAWQWLVPPSYAPPSYVSMSLALAVAVARLLPSLAASLVPSLAPS